MFSRFNVMPQIAVAIIDIVIFLYAAPTYKDMYILTGCIIMLAILSRSIIRSAFKNDGTLCINKTLGKSSVYIDWCGADKFIKDKCVMLDVVQYPDAKSRSKNRKQY